MKPLPQLPKSAAKNLSAAAAIITQHRPPKGGVCIVAAGSTRGKAQKRAAKTGPRESRSKAAKAAKGPVAGSDPAAEMPRIRAQRPLPRAGSPRGCSDPRDARYVRDYEAWVAAMSPAERARAAALGVDRPMVESHRANGTGAGGDVADSSAASYTPDIAGLVDGPAAQDGDLEAFAGEAVRHFVWDVVRRLVGELLDSPNRSLTAECLAAVSGMSYTGDSITSIARRHGVTRAAVSKRCVELTHKLLLVPSRTMRSLTARESYRHAQQQLRNAYET